MDIQPAFHYAGDGRLMEKVFTNVIGKAVDYSHVGATVTVSLQNGIFFVENSGIHIAEEDLNKIPGLAAAVKADLDILWLIY